ncbi:MAG: undecaprenyl-diphosphate phosphatase [Gammaproteobacteria bacterium]|nr:undecaprenyl-diphosphate phosphatase [Gammaproteobacteria bacterium]
MDWLQAIVLAIVQGITEFLPISSAAHLILVPVITGWEDQGLAFDVALHIGSLVAVVWYFRRELGAMTVDWIASLRGRGLTADARLAWAVGLGTIPVGIAGIIFRDHVELLLRSPVVLATSLIGFGLLLGWADWRWRGNRSEYDIGWREVLVIALAQALALIPGTSRSGITMTAALFVGMSREGASRFSFLLSIPVIFLAGALETRSLIAASAEIDWLILGVATVVSGLSAYLCIHYFLAFIKRIGMQPFVVYRVVLGVVLLSVFWRPFTNLA